MVIFGWGFRTKRELGALGPYMCGTCGQGAYFLLVRSTSWFSLFFIPLIPYSRKHYVVCKNCGSATEIAPPGVKELLKQVEASGPP